MDGVIVIDKPGGCTSHDVVLRVRRLLGIRRVGHFGTLDPDATGILLVAVGQATRFFPYLSKRDKTYEGAIRLGFSTDTYDAAGRPTSEERYDYPERDEAAAAMRRMEGEQLQMPPPYSAKKMAGKSLYKLARARKEVVLKPSPVNIYRFSLEEFSPPFVRFIASCSSGTYIRSLAQDFGRILGCGAHLHSLRRTAVGVYSLEKAVLLSEFENKVQAGESDSLLVPLKDLLPEYPEISVPAHLESLVLNGAPLSRDSLPFDRPVDFDPHGEARFRLLNTRQELLALAKLSPEGDKFLPFLVLS